MLPLRHSQMACKIHPDVTSRVHNLPDHAEDFLDSSQQQHLEHLIAVVALSSNISCGCRAAVRHDSGARDAARAGQSTRRVHAGRRLGAQLRGGGSALTRVDIDSISIAMRQGGDRRRRPATPWRVEAASLQLRAPQRRAARTQRGRAGAACQPWPRLQARFASGVGGGAKRRKNRHA